MLTGESVGGEEAPGGHHFLALGGPVDRVDPSAPAGPLLVRPGITHVIWFNETG